MSNQIGCSPVTVNHVGICVGDVIAAIDFYRDALGMRCIMAPRVLLPPSDPSRSPLGPLFKRAWQAHLISAEGVGFELFQFIDPPVAPNPGEIRFWEPGTWHVCVTDSDVAGRAARIAAAGGRVWHEPVEFITGRPYRLVYCSDPWGTVIEVMSHTYSEVFSSWPQPGMTVPTVYVDVLQRTELPPERLPDWIA